MHLRCRLYCNVDSIAKNSKLVRGFNCKADFNTSPTVLVMSSPACDLGMDSHFILS